MSKLLDAMWRSTVNALAQGSDMDAFSTARLVAGCEHFRSYVRSKEQIGTDEGAWLTKAVLPVFRKTLTDPKTNRCAPEEIVQALIVFAEGEAQNIEGAFVYKPECVVAGAEDPEADMMAKFAEDFVALIDVIGVNNI